MNDRESAVCKIRNVSVIFSTDYFNKKYIKKQKSVCGDVMNVSRVRAYLRN